MQNTFRIHVKTFDEKTHDYIFRSLGEATYAFFMYMGDTVHRLELHQCMNDDSSQDRLIIHASRMIAGEPMKVRRTFNIF